MPMDPRLREVLERLTRASQANFDHLSGEARENARQFNKLAEDVATLYDLLGAEYDPNVDQSTSLTNVSDISDHDELSGVSANDHHNEDHDHDGSPTQKLTQANTHQSPDTDSGTSSLHHTIGASGTQSAAGNHTHVIGAGTIAIEEDNVSVDTAVTTVDFGHGLDVTTDGVDEVNITVDETELTHNSLGGRTTSTAHPASAVTVDSTTLVGVGTDVQAVFEELDDAIVAEASARAAADTALAAPDYLVGTATGTLSGEIPVGTSPGGELGGTWASPTVDATHSGSAHIALGATEPGAVSTTSSGTAGAGATASKVDHSHDIGFDDAGSDPVAVNTSAADGTEGSAARKDHRHAHETAHVAHDTIWDAANDYVRGSGADTGTRQAASAATPAAVSTAGSTGTAANPPSADDHVHAHEAAHINHDTTWAAKGDLIAATGNDAAAVVTVGSDGKFLKADSGAASGVSWATVSAGAVATDAIWDAKGDLAAGTGADTASKLSVGADDTILMADSAAGTGLKWVAAATPSTQAFGDAAAAGTSDTFTRGDHKHAMPATSVVHADVQTFTADGTWTKPSGYTMARIICIGQGGGGGSGRFAPQGTNRGGGGGGGGGNRVVLDVPISLLGATEAVTCANTGGVGGTAVTGAIAGTVAGNAGTAGSDATFGGSTFTKITGQGGNGGGAGGTSGGSAGGSSDPFGLGKATVGEFNFMQLATAGTAGQLNASPSAAGSTPSISNPRVQGAPGAPGAAGHSAANGAGTSQAGADCWGFAGGTTGGSTPGTNGGDGSSATTGHAVCGSSGGSGAPGSVLTGATNGGRGGDGGNYGAGGAGGGPACSTTSAGTSGRGGNGGLGVVQVISY